MSMQPIIIACGNYKNLPGAIHSHCANCNADIVMAPSSAQAVKENGAKAICLRCFAVQHEEDEREEGPNEVGVLPEGVEEVRQALAKATQQSNQEN